MKYFQTQYIYFVYISRIILQYCIEPHSYTIHSNQLSEIALLVYLIYIINLDMHLGLASIMRICIYMIHNPVHKAIKIVKFLFREWHLRVSNRLLIINMT